MQNLENLDVFEILITQKLLKCLKDPFLRSALIYILQPPFWVSLIFYFFHWNAQVSVKVSIMISVLGKIKEMCFVLYLSKKCVRVG